MTDESTSPPGAPLSYRVHRAAIVATFAMLLFLIGMGVSGRGPFGALGRPVDSAVVWVDEQRVRSLGDVSGAADGRRAPMETREINR